MKKMISVKNLDIIDRLINNVEAFAFGIKDLAINMPSYFNIEDIKDKVEYLNNNGKEVFIVLNKNMHNADLEKLEEILLKLNSLNIKGVLFYDIALVNLKNKLNLNYDLVWSQEHLTNNYFTCNYWLSEGVNYTMLSSEITIEEIINIRKNTHQKLIVPIFGYMPIFASLRPLVKNYLDTFNLKDNSKINYMYKELKEYPITSDKETVVYSSSLLNGLSESLILEENNIDYIFLNSFNITDEDFVKVIDIFNSVRNDNKEALEENLNKLFLNNTSKYFLHKETIYKVKNNGK